MRLRTSPVRGLTARDVSLARQISTAAHDLGVTAVPSAVQTVQTTLDVLVSVPHDQAEARVAAGVAAGGRIVSDRYAPACWTLADPGGQRGRHRHLDGAGVSL